MEISPTTLFITWTVYGTFLPGDKRGWRHRARGDVDAQPLLEKWNRERLKYCVLLLDKEMRNVAELAIGEICVVRDWKLWAANCRSNHMHVVVTAPEYEPSLVRDQLKAKATRELRASFNVWKERPVWSAKGDIEFLDAEDDIEQCVVYVAEAQDRKDREQ